jgi:Ca-activated chloride channel family protein
MNTRRRQFLVAGALLAGTALVGVAARGSGRGPGAGASNGAATFSASAKGPVRFTGTLDRRSVLLGGDGTARMELVIAAAAGEISRAARRPTDLVVVLDRSGSMMGEKMEHARAAIRELVGQLNAQDRFALVAYSDGAALAIPLSPADERGRSAWMSTVAAIEATGGTNMSSGLDLGLDLVEQGRGSGRVPHVILISDGLANQGDPSPQGLTRRAQRAAQGEYMLSTVGVGADFNEYLMSALADAGTGNYYYVQDTRALGEVFAREFDAARTTVASGLTVRIDPAAGVRVLDAAGYPLEPSGAGVVFRPGSLFAGQERRVWVTLAVPQAEIGEFDLGRFSLAYDGDAERSDPITLSFSETPRIACVKGEDEFYAGFDSDTWGRSVVVEAYNEMQEDVARAVKEGRREQAIMRLREFRDGAAEMNERLKSAPVAEQLGIVDRLEADVSAAFEGPEQEKRQNELSKAASAEAKDARRAGSKK